MKFSRSSIKRLLVAGGAVVMLGATAVGVSAVQAQTTPTPTSQTQSPRDKFLAALANRLHISVDQLQQAISGARQDAGLPAQPNGQRPNGLGPGGAGHGPRGFAGFMGAEATAVANLFHEDVPTLRTELAGNTLADVAAKHNVQVSDVVNTIVTTADQQIDQMAQQRNLPADRVNQIKQQISERAQQFVTTHRFPARGSGARS